MCDLIFSIWSSIWNKKLGNSNVKSFVFVIINQILPLNHDSRRIFRSNDCKLILIFDRIICIEKLFSFAIPGVFFSSSVNPISFFWLAQFLLNIFSMFSRLIKSSHFNCTIVGKKEKSNFTRQKLPLKLYH